MHYPGNGIFGCIAQLKGGTGKCSQNDLGLMRFALSWERYFRLHCGIWRRNSKVLPEWCGTNAFCTILERALSVALRNRQEEPGSAPRTVWDQCFSHYPGKGTSGCSAELRGETGKCSQNDLGPMLFALSWKGHFRLHCGTERRHWEVLPEWSGTNAFCTILGKVLPVALRHLQSHPEPGSAPRMVWD